MPGDVTHARSPVRRPAPCPANHQRRITVTIVRHGGFPDSHGPWTARGAIKISKFCLIYQASRMPRSSLFFLSKGTWQMIHTAGRPAPTL